jgi:hypothetical protein
MKRLFIIGCVALVAISCRKENSNEFFPYANNELNDTNWYSIVSPSARVRKLDSAFALASRQDSVDITTGGTITLSDSVQISFPPNFCSIPAVPPTSSKVNIEMIHLKQKGDMVRMNRPTMSYHQLLITGGAVRIRATYNGQELQLSPGKLISVKIFNKMSNTNPVNDMRVFYGKDDAYPATTAQSFTWVPWLDSPYNRVSIVQATGGSTLRGYQFFSNRFGWINCDYFSDTTQPRTKARVFLPRNFTNANTNVYAVFKTPDIVAQLTPDPGSKTFNINNAYIGRVVTFISLSHLDGKLYMAAREVTITANMNISMVPEPKTQQQIESFLNSF